MDKQVMLSTIIVDDANIKQIVQSHDANIKSNQHRLDEVEDALCKNTTELSNKLDKLNNKLWFLLVVIAAYAGNGIITTLLTIGG